MHGHRGVAEHGLGRVVATVMNVEGRPVEVALDRIVEVPEMALHLDLLHLEVGDGGEQLRVPVDQPLVLVDEARAVKLDEHLGTARERPSSMVKRSRDQSQEAPSRFS